MKKQSIYLTLAIAAFAAATLLLLSTGPVQNAEAATTAIDFSLPGVDGGTVSLADYSGKVVLINFWATWCPPCRGEMPHFVDLYTKYKDDGLVIVGLSVDQGGADVVNQFLKSNPVNYPIAMADENTMAAYQGILPQDQRGGIPFSFIVDRDGIIRQALVGYRNEKQWEELITPLLQEKAPEK